MNLRPNIFIYVFILLFAFGCTNSLEPISYGKDDCHWCQMRIMDPKFGSEAVTEKGRIYKFDSGECLLHYLNEAGVSHSHLAVTNFDSPETFLDATSAWYLVSEAMPSPMGGNLNSFPDQESAKSYMDKVGGEVFSWEQIKQRYAK